MSSNSFRLDGRLALVTGSSTGIGKALAILAAAKGMKLVLADIDAAKLDATVAEFNAQGVEAVGLRTDVSKADQVDHLADLAFERFGNVHLLVNNAGVACAKPVWETTPGDWEWVVGVNLYGVTNGLRSFIPRMLAKGEEVQDIIRSDKEVAALQGNRRSASRRVNRTGKYTGSKEETRDKLNRKLHSDR